MACQDVLLAVACVFASACQGERTTRRSDTRAPVTGGTAVVGVAAGATTLLPPLARAALDYEISGSLFLALNFAAWGEGGLTYPESHPLVLARTRRFGDNGRSLTYTLSSSSAWSDGQPLRADDVAFTYRLLSNPALGLPLSAAAERLDSVTTPDDTTVVFHFRRPYAGMLFDTGVGIIPKHIYGEVPQESLMGLPRFQESGAAGVVVSGPFRVEEWKPDDRIVLVRNEEGAVTSMLDRVVIRIIPDEQTRIAELRSGNLDVAQISSYREARRLGRNSEIRLLRMPQRGYDYIAWNPAGHPAFADGRVRRALSLALDRRRILPALDMVGFGEPAAGPYGSLFSKLVPAPTDSLSFDPERAEKLLDEAGWRDRDGDGVREKDGTALEFELATTAGNERRESAAQIIQSQLEGLGVRARLRFEEFGSLLDRVIERQYEAALLGWQVGLDPDISPFWYDPESPFNVTGYDNPATRAAIDSAKAQPTAERAAPYWRQAAEEVAADYPYAFLWFFDLPVAVGPRVKGVEVDVTGFLQSMYQWWVPADRRTQTP